MGVGLLVGDCGGTNTRLKLIDLDTSGELGSVARGSSAPGTVSFEKKYQNEEYSDFLTIVKKFIEESGGKTPEAACLACAGPILGNTVLFTNIDEGWFIDGAVLEESLGIKKVMLVNDFTAMGYGLLTLTPDDVQTLNDVPPVEGGVVATVGAGTGLGECFLTKDPKASGYTCWATEGGHTDWAPRTDLELEFLDHMRLKYNQTSRISVERVISGNGISDIYEFLSGKYPDQINEQVHNDWKAAGAQKGGVVGQNSSEGLCKQAMQIFFTAYASELGNAMLKWLPTGGLYVSGGIAAKNISWIFDDPNFKEVVFDKGRVSGAIKQCPVYVCKTEDVGERGAHLVAYNGYRKIIGHKDSGAAKIAAVALSPMPDKTAQTEKVRAMDEDAMAAGTEPAKPAAEPKKEEPKAEVKAAEAPKAKEPAAAPAATPKIEEPKKEEAKPAGAGAAAAANKGTGPKPAAKKSPKASPKHKKKDGKKKDCIIQ